MKKLSLIILFGVALTISSAWLVIDKGDTIDFRCLIQLTNYGGEGAYVTVSLINPEGNYEQTLYVSGFEEEWYPDLPDWYTFYNDDYDSIDGITGASIQSGGRKVAVLKVPSDKLDNGYKMRFETAVEDQAYYGRDVEVDLKRDVANQAINGTGYIRHIKLISN